MEKLEMSLLEMLEKYGGDKQTMENLEKLGVKKVEDLDLLETADLVTAGMYLVPARRMLREVRELCTALTENGSAEGLAERGAFNDGLIRRVMEVPVDDAPLLEAIKKKNTLLVNDQAYVSAIRADLAHRAGLQDVLNKLLVEMEKYAVDNNRPVHDLFFQVRTLATQQSYAEIFAAMPSGSQKLVSKSRKRALLKTMQANFWPAVFEAYCEVCRWRKSWIDSLAPGAAIYFGGHQDAMMPPGVGMAPDVGPMRDAAEKLREAMNKSLSGLNSMVADAMLYDCIKVRDILMTEGLPEEIGVLDFDQMLNRLQVNIDAALVRTEHNLVRFVLGMIKSEEVGEDCEVDYFSKLYMLGTQVNWKLIGFEADELEVLRKRVDDFDAVVPEPLVISAASAVVVEETDPSMLSEGQPMAALPESDQRSGQQRERTLDVPRMVW